MLQKRRLGIQADPALLGGLVTSLVTQGWRYV